MATKNASATNPAPTQRYAISYTQLRPEMVMIPLTRHPIVQTAIPLFQKR